MELTDEQKHAVDVALTGNSMALEALAGTGKTTTLKAIAEQKPEQTGLYAAFNSDIKKEAERKFPANTECRTLHSLAWGAVASTHGNWFADRLKNAERLKFGQVARRLGIDPLIVPHWSGLGSRRMNPSRLAGYVQGMVAKFCRSADDEITAFHMPYVEGLDKPDDWTVHNLIGEHIKDYARDYWADITSPKGVMPFKHEHYLKMFQLMKPKLAYDFILLDEAQDLNPVMLAIMAGQTDTQTIAVGDQRQQIYEWNGAVNALASFDGERAMLTKSFRFGPEVANVANFVLAEMLGESVKVQGLGQAGRVGVIDRPDAVLCRRNATTIRRAAFEIGLGRKAHIVGGGKEISRFAYAAMDLQKGEFVSHPDLACFESWAELEEYIEEDEIGGDLEAMVRLVMDIGAPQIIETVKAAHGKRGAEITISTAHKSKGLEWSNVTLTKDLVGMSVNDQPEDYNPMKMTEEDKRLLYVACTRAESALDVSALPPLAHLAR